MNIPGDLAEKILQASLRNVAAKVGDEQTMSAQERDLMMMFAITPEMATRLRAYELVKRHCKCEDLTAAQWDEVHAVYPEFQPGSPIPDPPEGAPAFVLTPEPQRQKLTKEHLAELSTRYDKGARSIRRWHDEGAPIDDPVKLAAWWEAERAAGRKTWSVPDGILAAAQAALANVAAPSPDQDEAMGARPSADPLTAPDPAANAPSPTPPGRRINLEDYDGEEGDQLRKLKKLKAARWDELTARLNEGLDAGPQERAIIKLEDMISRIEARIEERLKRKGLFLAVDSVRRDIAKVTDLMKQMAESESRRVLELCPSLTAEARTQVAAAIIRVGVIRRRILGNIKSLRSPDDAVRELAAA